MTVGWCYRVLTHDDFWRNAFGVGFSKGAPRPR